jgi:hypothetical protein
LSFSLQAEILYTLPPVQCGILKIFKYPIFCSQAAIGENRGGGGDGIPIEERGSRLSVANFLSSSFTFLRVFSFENQNRMSRNGEKSRRLRGSRTRPSKESANQWRNRYWVLFFSLQILVSSTKVSYSSQIKKGCFCA